MYQPFAPILIEGFNHEGKSILHIAAYKVITLSKEFCKPQKGCKMRHITNFNVEEKGRLAPSSLREFYKGDF